jgi:hypothetical protein
VLFEPALCSKQAALARDADPCPASRSQTGMRAV